MICAEAKGNRFAWEVNIKVKVSSCKVACLQESGCRENKKGECIIRMDHGDEEILSNALAV